MHYCGYIVYDAILISIWLWLPLQFFYFYKSYTLEELLSFYTNTHLTYLRHRTFIYSFRQLLQL